MTYLRCYQNTWGCPTEMLSHKPSYIHWEPSVHFNTIPFVTSAPCLHSPTKKLAYIFFLLSSSVLIYFKRSHMVAILWCCHNNFLLCGTNTCLSYLTIPYSYDKSVDVIFLAQIKKKIIRLLSMTKPGQLHWHSISKMEMEWTLADNNIKADIINDFFNTRSAGFLLVKHSLNWGFNLWQRLSLCKSRQSYYYLWTASFQGQ